MHKDIYIDYAKENGKLMYVEENQIYCSFENKL